MLQLTTSVPSKPKQTGTFFGRQPTKIFENRHLQIWTQFLLLEKISQNKISLFFQKCAGHIFTI